MIVAALNQNSSLSWSLLFWLGLLVPSKAQEDISQYYSADPIQLLFGKFRDWDNVEPIHFIIFTASLTTAFVLYYKFLTVKTNLYLDREKQFPSTKWMQSTFSETLVTMPSFNATEEAVGNFKNAVLYPEDLGAGNPGWSTKPVRNLNLSLDNPKLQFMNFTKVIAESYQLIERLVVRRLPYLRVSRDRTIRVTITFICHCKL
mmetsp:Transcript_15416/g.21657  ORF Transcript_15416/g.21657 Transcript_15416/m.21657 type:complete len:203 (+) Transcript_15416:180-788(+)